MSRDIAADRAIVDIGMAVRQRGKVRGERSRHREKQSSQREKTSSVASLLEGFKIQRTAWIAAIAIGAAIFHSAHLHVLFENDRFFSHLSTLERELSFRTEMGLYYSYYKELVECGSLSEGWRAITSDNTTEYPDTINTLKRFNLYPEVILALLYRGYSLFLSLVGSTGVECYTINRGYDQPPITACNGFGDAAYFYVWWIFALNGVFASLLFLLAVYVSNSIIGGLLALAFFFFNHGEATRVMWTPPLRESFAMPFFMLQMLIYITVLRHPRPGKLQVFLLSLSSLSFMLPWQFAQFVLLTQQLSLAVVYSLGLVGPSHFLSVTLSIAVALFANILLQFANTLLLTSFLPPCLLVSMVVVACHKLFAKIPWLIVKSLCEIGSVFIGTVLFKPLFSWLLQAKDDAHIGAILFSKFTSYQDFHTQLYTCAAEFDYLPLGYVLKLTATMLLPTAVAAAGLVVLAVVSKVLLGRPVSIDGLPAMSYMVVQVLPFTALALLIMRLKLFLTPHLAILTSLLANKQISLGDVRRRTWPVAILLAAGSMVGMYNISNQWSIVGEFNSPEQESLVRWINETAPPSAVFAGAMPTMATIKLTTHRPIVNHPHYEDAKLRERTLLVYSIYSRKPASVVHSLLAGLGVTHVVVEDVWCSKRYRPGCALYEVWDHIDPNNRDKPVFCELIKEHTPDQFKLVFLNKSYRILQLL